LVYLGLRTRHNRCVAGDSHPSLVSRQRSDWERSEQFYALRFVPAVSILVCFIEIVSQNAIQRRRVILQLGDTEFFIYLHHRIVTAGIGGGLFPGLADGQEKQTHR